MTVLIVDDNRMNQLVTAHALTRLGHAFEMVSSGETAVAACSTSSYDLVLMDVMMPGMDGYEATARIRALETDQEARTVIIGLSARDMPGDREGALAAGLDDYLCKPLQADALEEALTRWNVVVPG